MNYDGIINMDKSSKQYDEWEDDFSIQKLSGECLVANNKNMSVVLLHDDEDVGMVKKRRIEIKEEGNVYKSCLLAELDGVKVYITKGQVIVTKKELLL